MIFLQKFIFIRRAPSRTPVLLRGARTSAREQGSESEALAGAAGKSRLFLQAGKSGPGTDKAGGESELWAGLRAAATYAK
jgi:hypothetical protein